MSSFGRLDMRKVRTISSAYAARTGGNEISLAVGDEVTVLRRHHSQGWDGWSTVRNHTQGGKEGIVPTSYVPPLGAV